MAGSFELRNHYQPLHSAIVNGDWKSTKAFLDNNPSALTAKITLLDETALHVATLRAKWKLVEKLLQLMPSNMVTEVDLKGFTCLHYVAFGKSIDTAKALVAKNSSVTQVRDSKGLTPLIYSIKSTRCIDMVWYLVLNHSTDLDYISGCPFSDGELAALVSAGFHDVTMYILMNYPISTTLFHKYGGGVLNILSKLPSHFQSGHNFGFWKRCIYHCVPVELDQYGITILNALQTLVPTINLVRDAKVRHACAVRLVEFLFCHALLEDGTSFVSPDIILNAASSGIVEILRVCFHYLPIMVWTLVPNEGYVAQIAIKNRQEKVFSLLCKTPAICKMQVMQILIDDEFEKYDTTSHMAAKLASQVESIPGAAFQMQRELQWFKEVEKMDHAGVAELKNQAKETPWEVFKKEHGTLLLEGKTWMKDTSESCMLVATLIATIAFAAAITVPGGNQDKGMPIFLSDNLFMVFVMSDALALFSSMTSLLMFLAILNARFTEEDFLMALPQKLIIGLAFLFLAIVTTMVAFGAALSMLVQERLKWAPIPIALLACVPIALFAMLQLPLLIEMIISTYGSRFSQSQ